MGPGYFSSDFVTDAIQEVSSLSEIYDGFFVCMRVVLIGPRYSEKKVALHLRLPYFQK